MLNIICVVFILVLVVECGLVFRTVIHMGRITCSTLNGRVFSVSDGETFYVKFRDTDPPPDRCDVTFYNDENALVCVMVSEYNINNCNVVLNYLSMNYSCNNRPLKNRCSEVGEQLQIQLITNELGTNSYNYSSFALEISKGEVNDGSFDYSLLVVPLIFGLAGLVTLALVCWLRMRNRSRNENQMVTTSYKGSISQQTTSSYIQQEPKTQDIPKTGHDTVTNVSQYQNSMSQDTQQQKQQQQQQKQQQQK